MSATFTAGKIKIEVSDYPMWVQVSDDTSTTLRLSHKDLADLKHCVERALARCQRIMWGHRHGETDPFHELELK